MIRFATAIILRKYDVFVTGQHVFYQKKTYTISLIFRSEKNESYNFATASYNESAKIIIKISLNVQNVLVILNIYIPG